MARNDQAALKLLETRIRVLLPEEYQDTYEDIQPVSMGSASLKYGSDGKVAWDDMWETFCDLAMAGGPPHKGMLLEPAAAAEIEAGPDRYEQVVNEICRGIKAVTDLDAQPSSRAGWIAIKCESPCMAGWLVRAVNMENVSCHSKEKTIYLPAGPGFRLEKEIKNVITVAAKTCHYWLDHMWLSQQREIASCFAGMTSEFPFIQPALSEDAHLPDRQTQLAAELGGMILQLTGLRPSSHQYRGWLGLECPNVGAAIWMMRALVASNVLSRREGTALFVPVNSNTDPTGSFVAQALSRIHRFAQARKVL